METLNTIDLSDEIFEFLSDIKDSKGEIGDFHTYTIFKYLEAVRAYHDIAPSSVILGSKLYKCELEATVIRLQTEIEILEELIRKEEASK